MKSNQLKERLMRYLPLNQKELKQVARTDLKGAGYNPVSKDGYLYAEGDTPILLVAHLDTVYRDKVKTENIKTLSLKKAYEKEKIEYEKITSKGGAYLGSVSYGVRSTQNAGYVANTGDIFNNYTKLKSAGYNTFLQCDGGIGGDDRCGVAIILHLASKLKSKPYVLLLEDEEIGCVGAAKFAKVWENYLSKNDINFIVELDRGEFDNVVFYNCANEDFAQYIIDTTGYELQYGSCSDISTIAPAMGIAAVNMTCGYYNEHKGSREFICLKQLEQTAVVAERLVEASLEIEKPFEYIDAYVAEGYNDYGGYYPEDDLYDMLNRIEYLESEMESLKRTVEDLQRYIRGA